MRKANVCLAVLSLVATMGHARAADLDPDAIAVRIGEEKISIRVVERQLKRATPTLPEDPAALRRLRAAAAQAVARRALVLQELIAQHKAATIADVEQAVARLKKDVEARGGKWDEHLSRVGLSEAEFLAETRWRMTWEAYLREQLVDANLQRYFEKHRREFDGTQLRVAHILLKLPADADRAARKAIIAKAQQLADTISAGQQSFADAAAALSEAPTAKEGGDIGFIERTQPMPEAFSKAAFALESGKVSPPVVTNIGVHVITCLEVKPGERTWQESREALRDAVTRYLFDWLADRRAAQVELEFMTGYPRLDPFSGEVEGPQ